MAARALDPETRQRTAGAAGGLDFPQEAKAIGERRKAYGLTGGGEVGLALSGGGIRSATFSLGILRALSTLNLLHKVDYLSTVSGGGYTGAFYCGLFAKRSETDEPAIKPSPDPKSHDLLSGQRAQMALRYLRQSGRYLTPAGASDYVYALALLLRNWVALTLVTGGSILALGLTCDVLRRMVSLFFDVSLKDRWLSPVALLLPLTIFGSIATAWGYWLTLRDVRATLRPPLIGTALIVAAAASIAMLAWPGPAAVVAASVAFSGAFGIISWLIASSREEPTGDAASRAGREDRIRHRLTVAQAICARASLILLAIALIDSSAYRLVEKAPDASVFIVSALVAILIPAARWLAKRLAALTPSPSGAAGAPAKPPLLARIGIPLAWLGAVALGAAALLFWVGLAHWLAWRGDLANYKPPTEFVGVTWPAILAWVQADWLAPAWLGAAIFVFLAAYSDGFVNLSSLATFYAGRLRRAYLGAGNPKRCGATGAIKAVDESHPGDDLNLDDYYERTRHGAPVHLINVTINETKGKGPATIQRDRKGLNMAITPDGFTYSPDSSPAVKIKPLTGDPELTAEQKSVEGIFKPDAPVAGQSLALSTWVGISGAAFTTGLGSRTNLAFSLLAFLANVRLGYWWKANRYAPHRGTAYHNLFREAVASFPGTSGAEWYLSDGGHFENTGVYELVRRRLPFIVASDNGCDPHYGFKDLANLVRKCRIDLGAEIEIFGKKRLNALVGHPEVRNLFAAPAQFAGDKKSDAIAMLGSITYADKSSGTLLIIKPRLTQDGPADLMRYFSDNSEFPQQTTLDQFFDEAQWESYYELGRRITERIFRHRDDAPWQPNMLEPLVAELGAPALHVQHAARPPGG